MRIWKKVVVFLVAFCLAFNAFAFWALAAPVTTTVMWLGRAMSANVSMARALEWSVMVHGAVISYVLWKKSTDTTPEASPPIAARLAVQPNTKAPRDNPDPTKWDSANSGNRNPTPKPSIKTPEMSDYPPQNQPICDIVSKSVDAPYATYSFSSGNYKTTYIATKTYTNPGSGMTTAGSYTCSGTYYYLWSKSEVFVPQCDPGYTLSGSGANTTCTLAVPPSAVKKPAGRTPCEVLQNTDGSWDIDSQNPECDAVGTSLTKSGDGKSISFNRGDGTFDQIRNNPDGGQTIKTGNRTIELGPEDSGGNRPIRSISDDGPFSGSGSGSGSGTTGSGGTSGTGAGTGTAVCGGPGLPACSTSIDDSGFNGKDATLDAAAGDAKGKLDDREAFINSKATDNSSFGLDTSWIPSLLPGPAVECSALKWEPGISHGPLSGAAGVVDIDWCSKIDMVREYYAWLVGMLTLWAIAMLFFSANGNSGRPGGK